jgi:class 3 adenylate cyclase/tetratricopeptide (TPR) repeat protein
MLTHLRGMTPVALAQVPSLEAAEVVGQRREVSVMFVDITNFTHAVDLLGTEDVFRVKNSLMEKMFKVINRYEGTIEKSSDDGLMALFGIPINHENDPERAVQAALDIQECVHQQMGLSTYKHDLELGVRIGINTGVVIVGKPKSKYPLEYIVVGNTVDLASRLITHARPGTILLGFQTYKRVRPFITFEILPSIIEKGYKQPIQAYKPTGLRRLPEHIRQTAGYESPYIGRQDLIDRLDEVLSRVKNDQTPHILYLSGEAGLGKTRLIAEFRKSKAGSAIKFHSASCSSSMRVTPYLVLQKILRAILHISVTDSTRDQTEAVLNHVAFLGLDENDIAPFLLHVLGLPLVHPFSSARFNLLEPKVLQRQTHAALKAILSAEARLSATVLIFDDLHWVDQATKEFLEYYSQVVDQAPILLILVSRDFDSHPVIHPDMENTLQSLNRLTRITLQPLTSKETQNLVAGSLRGADANVARAIETISERAEGNPFYTEEITRMLIERGGLVQVNGHWQTHPMLEKMIREIPVRLKDIILARFDRLSENYQLILQIAALLGTSFTAFLLQTQVDEDNKTLTETLSQLEQRKFLISSLEGMDMVYSFKQAIVRDIIYSSMLERDRKRYHYQVAQTIKTFEFWLPGEKSEILAYHLQESSNPLEAIPHLITAGEKAAERFANKLAAKHYQDALTLLEAAEEIDPMDYASAKTGLGKSLKSAGEFEEASEVLHEAIEQMQTLLAGQAEKREAILTLITDGYRELADIRAREGRLEQGLDDLEAGIKTLGEAPESEYPGLWRRLIDRVIWIRFLQGKLELAKSTAEKALAEADLWGADDPLTLASLHNTLGGISWMQSSYKEAIGYVQQSLDIYKKINYHWGKAIASTNLGVLHFSKGNWPEAVGLFEQAEAIQVEQGYLPDRPTNLKNLGEILMNMGDYPAAWKHLSTSQRISSQLGMSINEAYAELGLCRLSIYQENFIEAEKHLWNAAALVEDYQDQVDDRHISIRLLEALIRAERGEMLEALKLGSEALEMAAKGGFPGEKTEAQRIFGMLCALAGKHTQAEALLLDSLQLATEQENPYHQAQAHYELGCLYALQSRQADEAQNYQEWEHFSQKALFEFKLAMKQFDRLGARHDLGEAEKALAQLSLPPR